MIDLHWYLNTPDGTTHGKRTVSREHLLQMLTRNRVIFTDGPQGPCVGWYDSTNAKGYYAYIDFKESY
jgi:hypothetical protein